MKRFIKRFFKVLLALGIFLFGVGVTALLWKTKPEAEKKKQDNSLPAVEVMPVEFERIRFTIPSQGMVEADRRAQLATEVAGQVIRVSENFEVGNRVAAGEILIEIDPVNYEATLAQAKSTLADAKAALASEEARAAQAERDYRKMGRGGTPSDLVLRKPQVASARARVESSEVMVQKAEKDLERTKVKAPFDSIVSMTAAEVGSYAAPGAPVAEVFETSPYEVRLPISVDDAAFLQLNEKGDFAGDVKISTSAAGGIRIWKGKIKRTEGEINRATRSLYLIAEIEDSKATANMSIRPGLFVEAGIEGREVENVASIPFRAFLDLNRVAVVDPDDKLRFREVKVLRRQGELVYVAGGLQEEERVCLTELPEMVEGMSVAIQMAEDSTEPTSPPLTEAPTPAKP